MRLFRITLSHGSESITFDGAGARSGSMFHVRRDAIEGLWSSPASKVSLTERETANGASPISDGETLYAARTVAIPFAIQSNYNHTDLIRARTLLGRLLGWHDVRMDINDDGDETVLYGYIEAKYSDIPYDHTDAGVITVVCPDPRRASKRASTVTLNTSSSSLGGLSYGVPAYELAWNGTPNASTSTLSQDGQVVATNLVTDPNALTMAKIGIKVNGAWGYANPVADGDHWRVIIDPSWSAATYTNFFNAWRDTGDVVVITADANADKIWVQNGTLISHTGTMTAYRIGASSLGDAGLYFNFNADGLQSGEGVTITGYGVYTSAEWNAMQSLGIDWFSGDSQSPQPNAGLAFPLNFGQTGNAGNTGMISNNGSYTSMPTITAHGWLNGGLTIHWNTSDGNEGDLSFNGNVGNVPVTINTEIGRASCRERV